MSKPRHPNKHIQAAIRYAESLGWVLQKAHGHAWGHLYCPRGGRDGCIIGVWSTPRSPENHARHLRRKIDGCPHQQPEHEQHHEQEDLEGENGDGN